MGYHFTQHRSAEVPATPEEVWEAIATGPGITSWFMGQNTVQPGFVQTVFGAYTPKLAIKAFDRPLRFSYGNDPEADGRFIAYEFLIEACQGSATVVRTVTSGFIPGDDWSNEYEAMTLGTDFYFQTLVEYLSTFIGKQATPLTIFGQRTRDWSHTRAGILQAFGQDDPLQVDAPVSAHIEGIGDIEGTVYYTNARSIGIRTSDALYRFIQGFGKAHIAAHLLFHPVENIEEMEKAWRTWFDEMGK